MDFQVMISSKFRNTCQSGHTDVVKMLLNQYAQHIDVNAKNDGGYIGFILACRNEHSIISASFGGCVKYQPKLLTSSNEFLFYFTMVCCYNMGVQAVYDYAEVAVWNFFSTSIIPS